MLAIGDDQTLCLLEFVENRKLKRKIETLVKQAKKVVVAGSSSPLKSIEQELYEYFSGNLIYFKTPLATFGSTFQTHVWEELLKIPFGSTCSYTDIAKRVGNPLAVRAVANANGANRLAIVIPCHRVIAACGGIGGYGGGIARKQGLLKLEKRK